jgi:hypothetical protein
MTEQLQFFASLDFPGRTTLLLREIAERVGCSVKHLCNQIDEQELAAIDIGSKGSDRVSARVPVECYREWVLKNLTGPVDLRMRFLADLPEVTRRQLLAELLRSFPAPARKGIARQLWEAAR